MFITCLKTGKSTVTVDFSVKGGGEAGEKNRGGRQSLGCPLSLACGLERCQPKGDVNPSARRPAMS